MLRSLVRAFEGFTADTQAGLIYGTIFTVIPMAVLVIIAVVRALG